MKKITIIILLHLFLSLGSSAQNFIRTIDYSNTNNFLTQPSVVNVNAKMTIVIGTIAQDLRVPNSPTEIVVFALDENGSEIWSKKIYPLQKTGYFASAAVYDKIEEKIVITGYVSGANGSKDLLLCKLDLQGNITDSKVYSYSNDYPKVYGLDIEISNNSYLIVGLRIHENFKKSGFVMSADKKGLHVNWIKLYESTGTNREYDSFGDILKVERHPLGQELFFLTGSGEGPNGGSIMVNDLIDVNGNSLWSQPSAYKSTSSYSAIGKQALYSEQSDQFYVFGSFNVENDFSPIVLEGSTGNFVGSEDLHFHNYFLTGIEWFDKPKEKILVSVYDVEGFHDDADKHRFMIFDFSNMDYEIYEFNDVISPNYMKSINYDEITKVVTQISSIFNYENFYSPKALTSSQDGTSFYAMSPFDVNFNYYKMDKNTFLDGCSTSSISGFDLDPAHISYNHIQVFNSNVRLIQPQYGIVNLSPLIYDYCDPSEVTKLTQENKSLDVNYLNLSELKIYPNPTKNKLQIEGLDHLEGVDKIEVYNINGKKVLSYNLTHSLSQKEIDLSKLQSGVYFIELLNANSTTIINRKVVKE